jgi:hypothetical protein
MLRFGQHLIFGETILGDIFRPSCGEVLGAFKVRSGNKLAVLVVIFSVGELHYHCCHIVSALLHARHQQLAQNKGDIVRLLQTTQNILYEF